MLPPPKTVSLKRFVTVHVFRGSEFSTAPGLRGGQFDRKRDIGLAESQTRSLEIVSSPNKSKQLIRQLRTLLATSG
jgi:hypothetical protein